MSLAFFQTQLGRFLFWPLKAECSHGGWSTCWSIGMSCSLQISMKQIRRKMKPLRSQRNHHPKEIPKGPVMQKIPGSSWTFDMTKLSTKKQAMVLPLKTASKLLWCCPLNSGFPEFESVTIFIDNLFSARWIACMCIQTYQLPSRGTLRRWVFGAWIHSSQVRCCFLLEASCL